MNGSKKWGFIWWSTGNIAGRSTCSFLIEAGCDDFTDYEKGGWRTHKQGVPKELENCPIISSARNPYDRALGVAQTHSKDRYRAGKGEMTFEELRIAVKAVVSNKRWNDDAFWMQFPLLDAYPTYYIRVENMEEDILSIPCIVNNADPFALETALEKNIRRNAYKSSEMKRFQPDTWLDNDKQPIKYFKDGTKMPDNYEMKIKQVYRKNGNRLWEPYFDQELADFVYEKWEDGFTLMGYDRDSWKQK